MISISRISKLFIGIRYTTTTLAKYRRPWDTNILYAGRISFRRTRTWSNSWSFHQTGTEYSALINNSCRERDRGITFHDGSTLITKKKNQQYFVSFEGIGILRWIYMNTVFNLIPFPILSLVPSEYMSNTLKKPLHLYITVTDFSQFLFPVPICLPRDGDDFTGRMATVTGWGRLKYDGGVPSVLQEVQVPIMENHVCQEMFRTAGHAKVILESFLCAGYANGQKDSCEASRFRLFF